MKRYMNMPDTRPLNEWGLPIGKPYEEKDWDRLTPDEMRADFEWKSDILDTFGENVDYDTFYQEYLFRELYNGELSSDYKVMVTQYDAEKSNKVHKVDVDEIGKFIGLSDVALSPCLFYRNWRRKDLMNYIGAFVLDIDKLRPMQLQRFFSLFDEGRILRPSFIANSGSGVHFYYVLDKMFRCDAHTFETERLIAEEIYKCLYDDVIKKERWDSAQRHWIGQDYRVVNSRTKFGQVAQIFMVGDLYTVEQLVAHYGIEVDRGRRYASKGMITYAGNIAKELGIDPPDYSDAKATHRFISEHKDAAYQVREQRRAERQAKEAAKKKKKPGASKKKPVTWYRNTLAHMRDNTQPNWRFSSMKALAMIAFKEKIPREVFLRDLHELAAYWAVFDWKGDSFNPKNVEAIERFFDDAAKYNASSETLEEWLGYEFKRIGVKRNGQTRDEHLEEARLIRDVRMRRQGRKWTDGNGAPSKEQLVAAYRAEHPEATVTEVARALEISRPTVYKWWNSKGEC